jgi:hypothetical protein
MANPANFFELRKAADLFRKLEADLADLQASQGTRDAYNFFVTAEHLPDWLGKRGLVKQHALLRVVSHIANGAKHFVLDDKRHRSVRGTEKNRYVEAGYVAPGYYDEPLIIHLASDEAKELGTSAIDASDLAQRVMAFWKPHVPTS